MDVFKLGRDFFNGSDKVLSYTKKLKIMQHKSNCSQNEDRCS